MIDKVTLVLDALDAQGIQIKAGTALIKPTSAPISDVPAITRAFSNDYIPTVDLYPNNVKGPQNSDGFPAWTYTISYSDTHTQVRSREFVISLVNGQTQTLSSLSTVPLELPGNMSVLSSDPDSLVNLLTPAETPLAFLAASVANSDMQRVDIAVIGDSITYGYGLTDENGESGFAFTWPQRANNIVRRGFLGGLGFIPAFDTSGLGSYTWPMSVSGYTADWLDLGPARVCTDGTSIGAVWTFLAPAGTTSVQVAYYDGGTPGEFTVQAGTGPILTVLNTNTLSDMTTDHISIAEGEYLTITITGYSTYFTGIIHYAGDEYSGITFHNFGRSGWCAGTEENDGWNRPQTYDLNWAQCYDSLFPNLGAIMIMLGTNDSSIGNGDRTPSEFQDDLLALIATIRASASKLATIPFFILVTHGHESEYVDSGNWSLYADAMRAAATIEGNTFVQDLSKSLNFPTSSGPLQYDSVHPNNLGASLIGAYFGGFLAGLLPVREEVTAAPIVSSKIAGTSEMTLDRQTATNVTLSSGDILFTYFTALASENVSSVTTFTEDTAGTAITTAMLGIYSVADDGTLTRIASVSDITLWAAAYAQYYKTWNVPWFKTAGKRYAVASLAIGSGMPKLDGNYVNGAAASLAPRVCASLAAQTTMPSTVSPESLVNDYRVIQAFINLY